MKRKRAALTGAVTRIHNRHKDYLRDDPSTLDETSLKRQLESVKLSDASYIQVHERLSETFPEDINEEEEMAAREQHDNSVSQVISILEQMLTLRTLHRNATELNRRLKELESEMTDNPDQSYAAGLHDIKEELKDLNQVLLQSTILSSHGINDLVQSLHTLVLRLTSTKIEPKSTPLDTSSSSISDVSSHSHIKLPKLSVPSFNGDVMKWAVFWERFQAIIHENPRLDNHEKLTYLREAISDLDACQLLSTTTVTAEQYDELTTLLRKRYDQKRVIHQHHVMALINCPHVKQGTHKELCSFVDTYLLNIRYLENVKQCDVGAILTSIATTQLPKRLNELWKHHSKDFKGDIKELLAFLSEHIDSTAGSSSTLTKPETVRESPRRPKASVYNVQSTQPRERQHSCTACRGEKHPLYSCNAFKNMSIDAKQEHVRNHRLCFNCLSFEHRTRECARCRKCNRLHHTILH